MATTNVSMLLDKQMNSSMKSSSSPCDQLKNALRGTIPFATRSIQLRPIQQSDIETLRVWKNENREFFLHQEIISPEQQRVWFKKFEENSQQQIFVCEENSRLIACVGFRTPGEKSIEMFNLMIGDSSLIGKGFGRVLFEFCKENWKELGFNRIFFKVMRSNIRAKESYVKWGFRFYDQDQDCDYMEIEMGESL